MLQAQTHNPHSTFTSRRTEISCLHRIIRAGYAIVQDFDLLLLRTFAAIVDEGSFTAAGKRVGRSQPAITHQLRRLEQTVNRKLIKVQRRRLTLTREGEMLLQYARTMLRLNDEVCAHFAAIDAETTVVLGTPDLYARYLLPDVLRSFARSYPKVEIELRCMRSVDLHAALERNEVDLALLTRLPEFTGGRFVRQEALSWVAAPGVYLETEKVLPLALLPVGSIARQLALQVLAEAKRSWRIASISDSIAGLQAAVFAGIAVSVLPECAIEPQMRLLAPTEGMPALPTVDLMIHHSVDGPSRVASELADHICQRLGGIGVSFGQQIGEKIA
jgi:DNA-binding transcriptional LysR family regulator